LGSFDAYKKNRSDAAKYLDLFNGRSLIVDRKGGDPIHVEFASTCIVGGVQPGILRRMLKQEHFENGMAARFLFLQPPRRAQSWTTAEMPSEARTAYERMIRNLHALDFIDANGRPAPRVLRLTPDAAALWQRFYDAHGQRILTVDGDVAAAFSKLEGYCARFALLFRLARWAGGRMVAEEPETVGQADMEAAICLTQWWCSETERLYTAFRENVQQAELRTLMETVQAHGGRMTASQYHMNNKSRCRTVELGRAALQRLVDSGLGHWEKGQSGPSGGRPTMAVVLEEVK
jgi:hypothetical protein